MIGSHPQRIVVTPAAFILGMRFWAWLDMVPRSSWYSTFWPGWQLYFCSVVRAICTDSWYQEFSGANVAMFRGLSLSAPPAHLAGLPHRRLPVYSAASLATSVPSVASDQMNGRCWSCQGWERYGSPK